MDNRIISIQSEGRKDFNLAFELLFKDHKATHYFEDPTKGFIFLWHEEPSAIRLPYSLGWQGSASWAWGWLLERKDADYKEYLDHDGDNGRGFRIYNGEWGHVVGHPYSICAVLPVWAWYAK
jgi:hypothetical protein